MPQEATSTRAWTMLALGVLAQAAGTMLVSAPVYLIPLLHIEQGMPLATAGLLASAPTLGMVLTLVLWGAAADRYGERWVIACGLAATAVCAFAASTLSSGGLVPLAVALLLGGAMAASSNAASGRVVVGWFPRHRRGLAMGVRQMSQPLGVAAAAVVVPPLASGGGPVAVFAVIGALLSVVTVGCALGIRNPPRPPREPARSASASSSHSIPNPYRESGFLVRIHTVSLLLVLPQFAIATFGMVWLITELDWGQTAAGLLMGLSQFAGALGRIVAGSLSDRVGDRVRVLRWVAASGVALMLILAAVGVLHAPVLGGIVLVMATIVSVADNGLAYTSVAEAAGSGWAGRALGIQNTGQFVAASAVGPGLGAAIALLGYPAVFALVALAPLVSFPLIPRRDRHRDALVDPSPAPVGAPAAPVHSTRRQDQAEGRSRSTH